MRIPRRFPKLVAPSGRVLVVVPTLFGYVLMALGIPIPIRAAQEPHRPAATQVRVCCCRGCDHSKKKCCCCGSDETTDEVRSGPLVVPSPPRGSPLGQAAGASWQVYIAAPSCDQAAKLWLTDNPISVPASPLLWQVALHLVGWLSPVDNSAFALTLCPPSPPPRG